VVVTKLIDVASGHFSLPDASKTYQRPGWIWVTSSQGGSEVSNDGKLTNSFLRMSRIEFYDVVEFST